MRKRTVPSPRACINRLNVWNEQHRPPVWPAKTATYCNLCTIIPNSAADTETIATT